MNDTNQEAGNRLLADLFSDGDALEKEDRSTDKHSEADPSAEGNFRGYLGLLWPGELRNLCHYERRSKLQRSGSDGPWNRKAGHC